VPVSSRRERAGLPWAADCHALPVREDRPGALTAEGLSMRRLAFLVGAVLLTGACSRQSPLPIEVAPSSVTVRYAGHVAPILEKRCVVCHSCYNAPCQLELSSFEGLDRGGSKIPVYSGARLKHQAPTRLFFDARTTAEWRAKGFHGVTADTAAGADASILLQLLAAKLRRPLESGEYHAEAEDVSCVADSGELGRFLGKHPERGMPFGFPPLSTLEYATIATWLQQGAAGPTPEEQRDLKSPSAAAATEIAKWEAFLNGSDAKHALTARYLYEHFFLAHVNFPKTGPGEFFALVRSATPPGQDIAVIATVRPTDDPGAAPFYYRFRKLHSAIVHKTHMVVEFDDATLARLRELFIDTPWLMDPHRVETNAETEANPFLVYAQIPPRVRYQFMLDHSEYILRTFIRGPVCKGQIALNVINDHFWVAFLDPAADLTVTNSDFLVQQEGNLRMPTEKGSEGWTVEAFSDEYRDRYVRFYRAKAALYDEHDPEGLGIDAIWKGAKPADAPILTIYRHFDSASVHKGVLGGLPRTLWVIDYPQLERIYYNLVAGFDVFGDVTHQVSVRRYMDFLRIEGELNFLGFLPTEARVPLLQSWYIGDRAVENVRHEEVLTERGTQVVFTTDDPKREFVERIVDEHILESTGIDFDSINYQRAGQPEPPMPTGFTTHEDILNGFRALTAPGTGFIRHLNESSVNFLLVRVRNYEGSDRIFSIVINRWHDNVNSMFRETARLDAAKDTIDFIPGSISSYPNYFLDLEAADVPGFIDMLANFDGSELYRAKIRKYGVNRADPDFWEVYDWFQARLDASDPLRAGRYDLNRYYPTALAASD
jgi:hypothetical protein